MAHRIPRTEAALYGTIARIYDAAMDPSLWPNVLNQIAHDVMGNQGAIMVHDFDTARGSITVNVGIDPSWQRGYDEYYCMRNVWVAASLKQQPGTAFTSEQLLGTKDLIRTEFYNDFLRPQGILFQLAAGLFMDQHAAGGLAITRFKDQAPFTDEEASVLGILVPHLQRAIQIHRRLLEGEVKSAGLVGALDRVSLGVLLVDSAARVIVANKSAERILSANDGLRATSQGLTAASSGETSSLRALIRGAAAAASGSSTANGGEISLPRPSQRRPLSVLVAPLRLPDDAAFRIARPLAAVFVSDPDQTSETAPDVLRRLYRLTPAEARLASLLVAGRTLAEAAEMLGVTVLTARTVVKRVFQKTETRRQSDLVRLLLTGPPGLARG
jgi:DNA-binding CsgD family transcriptional regulator